MRAAYRSLVVIAGVVAWLLAAPGSAQAAVLFVDGQLAADCADYDPVARACGGGTDAAWVAPNDAIDAAVPGDEVRLREGTYSDQLTITVSGTAGAEITIGAYNGETVVLDSSAGPAAIVLDSVSWLILEDLTVQDARWVEATAVTHVTLRDNQFLSTPASGTTGNVRFISSDDNRIEGNVLDDGNDNLLLIDSDRNLVADNVITEGRHSVLSVRCSNHNVFRGNNFANSQQKIGEIYDCGADTSAVPNAFDATSRNLFEGNLFTEAVTYYSTSGGNGIQYAAQDGILRRNVFFGTNVGLGMQVYDDEALYNHDNRIYHNVFYDNHCAGISLSSAAVGNVFVNNILAANRGVSGDCFGDGTAQLLYRNPLSEIYFEANAFWAGAAGEVVIQDEFGSGGSLADYEASDPGFFVGNFDTDPLFEDGPGHNFALQPTSPLVDAGVFLTRTVGAGSGTTLPVMDARFFYDGFGIAGEEGDLIALEGSTDNVRVLAVDLTTNELTLSAPLTWGAGEGVTLAYLGDGPDVGAFELGTTSCGDGVCEGAETCQSCEADCGECAPCVDLDGDGYGDPASDQCTYSTRDCEDDDPDVNPEMDEICDDGIDNNCDGRVDGDDNACDPDPSDGGGCGCASGRGGAGLGLALLFGLLWWLRRRAA